MELTILLSKVFGVYFVVMGVFVLLRREWFKAVVTSFAEVPALRFVMGMFMFFGGVFMIVSHQDWSNFSSGFISFLGWAVALKALLYMNLSNIAIKKFTWLKTSDKYGWIMGLLSLALGLYLSNFAFGWY
ncbi:MAG: hypothetical protein EXS69_00680 [Candidatus Zambryskibacteria bacterium]|nr:hypothetical protein [Candidatus Zambryskibacteria bacterium]